MYREKALSKCTGIIESDMESFKKACNAHILPQALVSEHFWIISFVFCDGLEFDILLHWGVLEFGEKICWSTFTNAISCSKLPLDEELSVLWNFKGLKGFIFIHVIDLFFLGSKDGQWPNSQQLRFYRHLKNGHKVPQISQKGLPKFRVWAKILKKQTFPHFWSIFLEICMNVVLSNNEKLLE